ncbi:MAG: hypothetical protein M3461_05655 [Pseudomonadota bacterium]|nr:hypothetical protein [Pseudomonadota bacterium]
MSWLSNLSDAERWAFGLLAFLCIAIVSHMLATRRDRHARRAKACVDFNAAVLDAFSGLYPIPKNWPSDKGAIVYMLEERFPLLQAAVRKFRPNVPIHKRWLFDRAWRIYHLGADLEIYWQYVPHHGEGVERVNDTNMTTG